MLLVFGGHGSCVRSTLSHACAGALFETVRAIHAGARGSSIPPVDLPSVQSARWSSSRTRFGPPFHASQLRQVVAMLVVSVYHRTTFQVTVRQVRADC